MIDKRCLSIAAALQGVGDGATVLLGGFGVVGHPTALIQGLAESGVGDLTIVANNAGFDRGPGLPELMRRGRVRKLVCSFPKGSPVFDELFRAGRIELEIVPQGTLAERIRAAGAGIPAFYTRTGVGTQLAIGKETRSFDGVTYLLERALRADVALIAAWRADRWGNLGYRGSGRNFNPVMATAAALTIAQVDDCVELGELRADEIGTPGIYVDRVVKIDSTLRVARDAAMAA